MGGDSRAAISLTVESMGAVRPSRAAAASLFQPQSGAEGARADVGARGLVTEAGGARLALEADRLSFLPVVVGGVA